MMPQPFNLNFIHIVLICLLGQISTSQDLLIYSGELKPPIHNRLFRIDLCTGEVLNDLCPFPKANFFSPVYGITMTQEGIMEVYVEKDFGKIDTFYKGIIKECQKIDYEPLDRSSCCNYDVLGGNLCKYYGLCSDKNPYGAWVGGKCLAKVISKRDPDVSKWISIVDYKGSFYPKVMHSITYRDGDLYGIYKNEFYKIDTINPASSQKLWTFPIDTIGFSTRPTLDDKYSHLHLESIQTKCGDWRTYLLVSALADSVGSYRKGIHLLDINTGKSKLVTDMVGKRYFDLLFGQTFYLDLADCDLKLDLDYDNSEGLAPIDYQWIGCSPTSIPVADNDVLFDRNFTGMIDSVTVILDSIYHIGQEYLEAGICNGISIRIDDDLHLTLINDGTASIMDFEDCIKALRLKFGIIDPNEGTRTVTLIAYTCGQVTKDAIAYLHVRKNAIAGNDNTINVCHNDTTINLNNYLSSDHSVGGRWEPKGPNITLPFDRTGIYKYIVQFPDCDPDTAIIEIKLYPIESSIIPSDTSICDGDVIVLEAGNKNNSYSWNTTQTTNSIEVADAGIYWVDITDLNGCIRRDSINIEVGQNTITELGTMEICEGDSIDIGHRIFKESGKKEVILQNFTGCDSIISLNLTVHPAFQNPISGDTLLCEGDSAQLISSIGLHDIVWSTGERSKEINVKMSGRYGFTAMDGNDCPLEAFINVRFNPPPQLDVLVKSETCRGQNDGIIEIINVGGQSDYTYLLDGQVINSTRIEDLTSGTYTILVTDKFGCTTNKEIIIDQGTEIAVNLGSDIEINTTDTTLQVSADILSGSTAKITWFVDDIEYGNGENPIDFSPTGDHTIKIIIEDENGCISEDIKQIIFRLNTDIFIPNTFSPNGDGINDWLEVFTKEDNNLDIKMTVYDRWGNLVYQSLQGEKPKWDGRFKGKNLPSAVYVYILEFKDASDKLIHNIGDVTLLR